VADTFKIRDLKITARAEVVMGDGSIAVVTLAPTELLGNWSAVAIDERAKRIIIDWLDGNSSIGGYDLRLPVPERPKFALIDPDAPLTVPDIKCVTVRRQRAFATAPYVGRPFIYWWWTGVDDHGRGVGGEKTTLAYTEAGWGPWMT